MKLFTYVLDTEGGTDWTEEHIVMAFDREDADRFFEEMKAKKLWPCDPRFTVILAVTEEHLEVPCCWGG